MKILAISLFFKPIWPDHGNRIPQMFLDSIQNDADVIVLSGKLPKEIEQNFEPNSKYEENLEIKRLWIPNINYNSLMGKFIINYIFFIQCFFHVIFSKKIDLMLCFVPYLPFFSLVLLPSKIKKIKSIIIHADAWPEVLKDLGIINNNSLYRFASKICIDTLNLSSKIITFTNELKELLLKHGINENKIITVNQGIDIQLFKPKLVKNNNTEFLAIYTGSFSPLYDFEIILDSAKKLKSYDIIFELIGDGSLKEEIKDYIKTNSLDNVLVKDSIKNTDELIDKINSADLAVIGINDNIQNNSTHPNKILEYLSCGLPIICSTKGAPRQLIKDSEGGIVLDNPNSDIFSQTLLELYENPSKCKIMSNNGRNYIEKNHAIDIFGNNISKILSQINNL